MTHQVIESFDQLKPSVDIANLTLSDWFAIAASFNQDERWGYYRWRDSSHPEKLKALSLENWEAIANAIGWSGGWAYKQYKEYSSPA